MNSSSSDLASRVRRCQTGVASVLRQARAREDRAAGLADLLLELIPDAVWIACLLQGAGADSLAIRSGKGLVSPEEELLRERLAALDPLDAEVRELPSASADGATILAVAIHEDERARGFLAIQWSGNTSTEDRTRVEVLLAVCASAVAGCWEGETARSEQAELARFALLGQAFVGLAHELNNALNSMMLQTSVVQLRVDAQARNDLASIRQHGAQAAALVRSLQHVVQERREKAYAVDLNSVLSDVLEETPALQQRVSVELAAESLPIQSVRSAVKQLVRLLLEGVLAATKSAVRVRTEKQEDGIVLNLETVEAPAVGEQDDPTPQAVLWQQLDEVSRHAGQSLLRQLGGALTVERKSEGGWVMRIVWRRSS